MTGSPTSNPRVSIQLLAANLVDAFEDRRDVIFGQTGTNGTATSSALNTDMHLSTEAELRTLFGTGDLYWRIIKWRSGAQVSDGGVLPGLDVVGIAPPSGAAAAATITFVDSATADGTFTVALVDDFEFTVSVSVTSGDTVTVIAGSLVTAINNLTNAPFTAANTAGVVTVTTSDLGTLGNDYGISIDFNISGPTVTITTFASGSGTPTLTSITDAIAGIRYTGVAWPEDWANTTIVAEMDSRFNVSNDVMDGVIFQGASGTFAANAALPESSNSPSLVLVGNNTVNLSTIRGPAILTPADWAAAFFVGVRDKRLSTGAQIADLIIATNGSADATGGPALASLPYFNTDLTDVSVVASTNLYSDTEQLELEVAGFTSFGPNRSGTAMIMGPLVTTSTTDSGGSSNDSFHYLNYVDTGSVCREIFFNTLKAKYAQSRLTEGTIVPQRSMANAQSIKAELLDIYRLLANNVLTQAGAAAEAFFSANTTVAIELSTRTVAISGPLPIVTQVGTINYNLSLAFTIEGTGIQITL